MGIFDTDGTPEQGWKVGALAKAAGLTVRALHHYDSIGLLSLLHPRLCRPSAV
jgi:hypothetical protein